MFVFASLFRDTFLKQYRIISPNVLEPGIKDAHDQFL